MNERENTSSVSLAAESFPSGGSQRTPEIIAGEIRTFTASMLNNVIEIGRRMVEVKALLPHGEFGDWIRAETGYSVSTANNFMRLFLEYGSDQGSLFGAEVNSQTFGNLSYSKALALLDVPREERESVVEELDAEHLSTRELKQALKERDEARKQLQDTSARLEQAEKTLAGAREHETELSRKLAAARDDIQAADKEFSESERALKARIKELESQPVEVAVERDEEAVQKAAEEARKAAEEAARAELAKLKAKLSRAEQAEKAAKEALETAKAECGGETAKAQEDAERARAEAEELRRKLRASETGAGEAALLAKMAQANFTEALEKIRAMREAHPETAEKLLAGMEQIAQALLESVQEVKG